jgi:hypothetical protein
MLLYIIRVKLIVVSNQILYNKINGGVIFVSNKIN